MKIKILSDGVAIGGFEVRLSNGPKNFGTIGKALAGALLFSSPKVTSASPKVISEFCIMGFPCHNSPPLVKYLRDNTGGLYKMQIDTEYSDYVPILDDKICAVTLMSDQPNVTWSHEMQTCASVISTTDAEFNNADAAILDCLANFWKIICTGNSNSYDRGILVMTVPLTMAIIFTAIITYAVYKSCHKAPDKTVTTETLTDDPLMPLRLLHCLVGLVQ